MPENGAICQGGNLGLGIQKAERGIYQGQEEALGRKKYIIKHETEMK